MSTIITITVIGATGRVGRLAVSEALARGHRVVALVRDPGRLPAELSHQLTAEAAGRLRVVTGELDDTAAVRDAVAGSGAVLLAAGVRYRGRHPWSGIAGRPDVVPAAVRAVLTAADTGLTSGIAADTDHTSGVDRHVVLLSAVGAAESWQTLPAVARWIIGSSSLRVSYAGLTEGEQLLRGSGLRHTVVRAVTLTDGPATRGPVDATGRRLRGNPKVSRSDVARLLVDTALATGSEGEGRGGGDRGRRGRVLVAAGIS